METRVEAIRDECRVPISVPIRLMWLQLRAGGRDLIRAGEGDPSGVTAAAHRDPEPKG